MSRITTRIALTVLIGLVILAAVFVSVRAVSASPQKASLGMYVLSGGLVNPLVERADPELAAPQSQPKAYPHGEGGGHGCESESYINPEE